MSSIYMHTIENSPALYQPGSYICYINNYHRVTTTEMFKSSLKQIRKEQEASAKYHNDHGDGHHPRYGYIRIKVQESQDN